MGAPCFPLTHKFYTGARGCQDFKSLVSEHVSRITVWIGIPPCLLPTFMFACIWPISISASFRLHKGTTWCWELGLTVPPKHTSQVGNIIQCYAGQWIEPEFINKRVVLPQRSRLYSRSPFMCSGCLSLPRLVWARDPFSAWHKGDISCATN